jgi:8-oxo-dGTP diphosphatase
LSSWVPESQIHHIPNAWGFKTHSNKPLSQGPYYSEHEVIAHTPDLEFTKTPTHPGSIEFGKLVNQNKKHTATVAALTKKPSLKKAMELAKGSRQRRMPASPKDIDPMHRKLVYDWQWNGSPEGQTYSSREHLPRLEGGHRDRALVDLGTKTQVRKGPNGREFLLHRGMSGHEAAKVLSGTADTKSSWTPNWITARNFADQYNSGNKDKDQVLSAWVPEEHIHHIPVQIGKTHEGRYYKNSFSGEHEVVVNPHQFQTHVQKGPAVTQTLLNQRINARGAYEKKAKVSRSNADKGTSPQGGTDVKGLGKSSGQESLVNDQTGIRHLREILPTRRGGGLSGGSGSPLQASSPARRPLKEVASVAVINDEGEILMGQRQDSETGAWTLPGGHLEKGEHPLTGAIRELWEEAGISAVFLRHLGTEIATGKDGISRVIHSYMLRGNYSTTGKNDPDKEVRTWHFVPTDGGLPEEVKNNLHTPKNCTLKLLGLL